MGNIPNTNTANLVLQSVGNGSNDSRWGTSGGGSTLPTGTGTGQMIWWNGTGWVVTVTPTTGSYLYWNGTAWANATAGDATSIQGYPVNVTGIGNGDVLYWSNVGAVQQWLTGPTPTGDGQIQYWNTSLSGHWSLSAAATTTGQALVWNNSTLTWGPANITLAGDVTGSAGANTVVNIQNYPVNMTGVGNGDLLYWSNVGTTQWLTGPTPGTTGDYYSWNTGLGGHWEILTTNPGGALSNRGWTSTSLVTSTLPTSVGKIVEVTGITGFSSYLIGFNITATNGDTTGRNLNAYIYQGSSAVSQQRQYMVGSQTGSTSVSYIASGLTSGTSYSFAGYAFQGGSTTGTVLFATITVLGIA